MITYPNTDRSDESIQSRKGGTVEELLVKPMEVAKSLKFGRSTIYDLVAAGVIPVVRINGSIRTPVAALREWVAKKTREDEATK